MKIYKNLKFIIVFSMAILISNACTDKFEELNTRNNLVTEDLVDVNLMLTRVQVKSIKEEIGGNFGNGYGNGIIGHYSGMSSTIGSRPFQEGDAPEVWSSTYSTYTNNLSEIIRLTKDDPELVNKKAIARIMKVWAFAKVTDTYGDIPYFESNLPIEQAIFDPKYDAQKSIYEDFFAELKAAATELDASKESYGGADLIYAGDVEKWRKFANSLRLRLALRVRYADQQMAIDNISDLQESDLILSRADDAIMFTSTDNVDNQNELYNYLQDFGSGFFKNVIGQEIVNNMTSKNDPRIKIWADTAKAEFPKDDPAIDYFGYRGMPVLGLVPVEYKFPWQLESASRVSDLWYVPVIEVPVMRSSEVYFALSEAALFGLRGGSAQAYYSAGVEAAMSWAKEFYETCAPQLPDVLETMYDWSEDDVALLIAHKELTQAEIDVFLASPATILTGSPEQQLEQIIVQKNISLYPLEHENWAEWRRTGYPIVQVGPDDDDLKGVSPRRMPWPDIEKTTNSESYKEALSRLSSGDNKLSKVWWDANPSVPYYNPDPLPSMDGPWVD